MQVSPFFFYRVHGCMSQLTLILTIQIVFFCVQQHCTNVSRLFSLFVVCEAPFPSILSYPMHAYVLPLGSLLCSKL